MMKVKLTKEMREKIHVGIIISAFSIIMYFLLMNFKVASGLWSTITSILFPFILGFAIAFLLNPIMVFFELKVFKNWQPKGKGKRIICMLISLLLALIAIVLLIRMIIPTIADSVTDLIVNNEYYINSFSRFITDVFEDFHLDTSKVKNIVGEGSEFLNQFANLFSNTVPTIVSTSYGIIKSLMNMIIGIAAAMYLLLDKEYFLRIAKKVNFAIFPKTVAHYLKSLSNVIRDVFYAFIVGKAIDSFIIGILCYIGLSLMNIQYALLLSVIVGITNMIPVFGPFIGAMPGILILLMVHPIHALYFTIFIIALQQLDGNVIGPLILGDKLGLPSFWILFSVTVGGALFGIVGMFIGVPTFAVIYYGVVEFINIRLSQKNIDIHE